MKQSFTSFIICLSFVAISISSCSKSSSQTMTNPTICTTDSCMLTSHIWRMTSQTVYTDKGNFKFTQEQLANIDWATFSFYPDSIFIAHDGNIHTYTYSDLTKILTLFEGNLILPFTVTSLTPVYMSINGGKVQMNPQTDFSIETNFAINGIAGGLHDNFGVDTSTIHYFQAEFDFTQ